MSRLLVIFNLKFVHYAGGKVLNNNLRTIERLQSVFITARDQGQHRIFLVLDKYTIMQ